MVNFGYLCPAPCNTLKLSEHLVGLYGADDVLPTLTACWVVHQRSAHTQKSYVRGKGGARGEMARTGKPYSQASRANTLSAAGSFCTYLDKVSDNGVTNPFAAVQRPVIDPESSPTPGYTEQEWATPLLTVRDHHRVAAYRKRAYALLLMLYTCCLRIGSLLHARVEDLGYDGGHRVLHLEKTKGGAHRKKPIPRSRGRHCRTTATAVSTAGCSAPPAAAGSTSPRCGGCRSRWPGAPGCPCAGTTASRATPSPTPWTDRMTVRTRCSGGPSTRTPTAPPRWPSKQSKPAWAVRSASPSSTRPATTRPHSSRPDRARHRRATSKVDQESPQGFARVTVARSLKVT
ncbi:hypothetical protein ABZ626_30810 [Streptomyces longispororuber]|uniref:hypothetical protein n=1 Tax=Streptomyces longispororuber TaxID=68230 RepID=UPI0033CCF5E8